MRHVGGISMGWAWSKRVQRRAHTWSVYYPVTPELYRPPTPALLGLPGPASLSVHLSPARTSVCTSVHNSVKCPLFSQMSINQSNVHISVIYSYLTRPWVLNVITSGGL